MSGTLLTLLRQGAVILAVFLAGSISGSAKAASQASTEHTQVSLISEAQIAPRDGESWFAVRIILDEGWHTYWLNSGDSGGAVELSWTLPDNVEAGEISWPFPKRISYGHLVNYGMTDDVWLLVPLRFSAIDPAVESLTLSVHVAMLVCEIQCVPEDAYLDLEIGISSQDEAVDIANFRSAQFEEARLKHPKRSLWGSEAWRQADRFIFKMEMPGVEGELFRDIRYFPVVDGWIRNAAEQRFRYQDGAVYLETEIGHAAARLFEEENSLDGVLVIEEELTTGTVIQPIYVTSEIPDVSPILNLFPTISVLEALLFAMIGGIILNAWPCVFPVLSIKILTLVREASGEPHEMRKQGLVYGASVVVGFLTIGGLFLGLRSIGEAVGWGFQLQSPVFVLILGYIMFAVALSLIGVFDFGLGFSVPQGADRAPRGTRGSMLTGFLAVVVASPCTAPFMVAAMGFALFAPTYISLLIFASLGFGMALPYMALAFWPALLSRLPKPGPWMERLKQLLAIPMLATVAWLFWFLTLQTNIRALIMALSGLVFIALAAWLLERRQNSQSRRMTMAVTAAVFAAVALAVVWDDSFRDGTRTGNGLAGSQFVSPIPSVPWSEEALNELRAEGKPVFLNFTAGWCITCLLNEQIAFSSDEVVKAFETYGITYMKADWTLRDDNITRALRNYGRSGVPLYILFGADGADGEILPQLLTEGILIDRIQKTTKN